MKDDILKSAMGKDEWGKSRRNGVQISRLLAQGSHMEICLILAMTYDVKNVASEGSSLKPWRPTFYRGSVI